MSEYRIEFSIQRTQPYAGTEEFVEVGFGSSGSWQDLEAAVHMVTSMVQSREWEVESGMPDPKDV